MVQYDLNLRDYWRILRKRKFIVIAATILVTIVSFLFATFQHPIPLYSSSVSLKIDENRTFTGLYLEALAFSAADTLETQTVIIKSYPVMEEVAKRMGVLDASLSSEQIRTDNSLLNEVLKLKNKITTEREGNTNIINVYATDESPQVAQILAAAVAEVFRDWSTREKNKRVFEARRFIEEQLRIVKTRLKESEEKVREYRESHRLMSLDAEASTLAANIARTEGLYNEVKREHENLRDMVLQLKKKKSITADVLQGLAGEFRSPVLSSLNSQLVNLTLRRDTLLLDFTEKHPQVVEVNKQIGELANSMLKELEGREKTLDLKEKQYLTDLESMKRKHSGLPQEGLALARLEREVKLNEDIVSQLESKHQEVLIKEAEKIEEVTIVKPALEPTQPINPPNRASTTAIGFLLGIVIGVAFAFIKESLDTSIGTIADVEEYLELPVLGIIDHTDSDTILEEVPQAIRDSGDLEESLYLSLASFLMSDSSIAENFRALEANVHYICTEKNAKVLLVTASTMGEGKTTVAINLASTFAEMNYKTLLIDADLRKPDVHRIFGLSREPGLTDIIYGTNKWTEVRNTVADMILGRLGVEGAMYTHGLGNLDIITAGTHYPNPTRLLTSEQMTRLIDEIKEEYEIVIVDSPPVLQSSDPIVIAERVDGVLLVYKVGVISRGLLKRTRDQLSAVKANSLGVILNQLKAEISPDFQERKYYHYYYSYGQEKEKKGKFASWLSSMQGDKSSEAAAGEEDRRGSRGARVTLIIIALTALIAGLYWSR